MSIRPSHPIRHTSRRLQMYRMVKFVIRHLFNAFKAYHKFPSTIASDARAKAISGRGTKSARKRPAINRNVGDNVNSYGVSNRRVGMRYGKQLSNESECRCQGFAPLSVLWLVSMLIPIASLQEAYAHISMSWSYLSADTLSWHELRALRGSPAHDTTNCTWRCVEVCSHSFFPVGILRPIS